MANRYFLLADSINSRIRKFRVIPSGYAHVLEKQQNVQKTLNGNLDVSVGSVQERYMFTVRVRHTEPATPDLYDVEYGTKDDLEYFYSLNNPNGSPSNVLSFQNHFGDQISVIMAGDFNAQLQGIQVDGSDAWFLINCAFMNVSPGP